MWVQLQEVQAHISSQFSCNAHNFGKVSSVESVTKSESQHGYRIASQAYVKDPR